MASGAKGVHMTVTSRRFCLALVFVFAVSLSALNGAQAAIAPALAWSPSTNGGFDFGTLDASAGQMASQTFTLSNSGLIRSGAVTITLSGSSVFTKTADSCTGKNLARHKSCTVTVKYAPTINGTSSATLAANSKSGASANLALTGTSAWRYGDLTTYDQAVWSATPTLNNYDTVYGSTFGVVLVGLPDPGFNVRFSGAPFVQDYLPARGPAAPLDESLADPTTTSSGVFGGDVLALELNVDFADAGVLPGNSGLKVGNLTVCGLTADTDLNGMTVRQVLSVENTALGGGTTTDSITDLDIVAADLNASFDEGVADSFAQTHLFPGACP